MIGHKQKLKHPETHNFSSKIAKNRTLDAQMVIFSQKWDFQLKLAFSRKFWSQNSHFWAKIWKFLFQVETEILNFWVKIRLFLFFSKIRKIGKVVFVNRKFNFWCQNDDFEGNTILVIFCKIKFLDWVWNLKFWTANNNS